MVRTRKCFRRIRDRTPRSEARALSVEQPYPTERLSGLKCSLHRESLRISKTSFEVRLVWSSRRALALKRFGSIFGFHGSFERFAYCQGESQVTKHGSMLQIRVTRQGHEQSRVALQNFDQSGVGRQGLSAESIRNGFCAELSRQTKKRTKDCRLTSGSKAQRRVI